jgi:hypothetical protein
MAIDSARKRESAMLMGGPLMPDGTIDFVDRVTLLAQYGGFLIVAAVTRLFSFDLHVERSRTVATGDESEAEGLKISRTRARNLYVERSRAASLEIV